MDNKQIELDAVEKEIIELLFGTKYEQDLTFRVLAKHIQKYINKFEIFCKPLMEEDGTIDGNALIHVLGEKHDIMRQFIPPKHFRLTELSKEVIYFLKGAGK